MEHISEPVTLEQQKSRASIAVVLGIVTLLVIAIGYTVWSAPAPDPLTASCSPDANVAVIPLKGEIVSIPMGMDAEGSVYLSDSYVRRALETAEADPRFAAVILDIDSPGGEITPSFEIAEAIERLEIPVVAYIRGLGASGSYLAASAADVVFAHRTASVGSIGVTSSYLSEVDKSLYEGYEYIELTSAPYKDAGSPYRPLSEDERSLFQTSVDELHDIFVDTVANYRGLSVADVAALADGSTFLAQRAADTGLIDGVATIYDVEEYVAGEIGEDIYRCEFTAEYDLLYPSYIE